VPLVFTVSNISRNPVTLQLLGRDPTADFKVSTVSGSAVWSRLRGQTLMGPLRLYPLAAAQSLSFKQVWDQRGDNGKPVPPGDYLVRAVLLTDDPNGLGSASVRLRVE